MAGRVFRVQGLSSDSLLLLEACEPSSSTAKPSKPPYRPEHLNSVGQFRSDFGSACSTIGFGSFS